MPVADIGDARKGVQKILYVSNRELTSAFGVNVVAFVALAAVMVASAWLTAALFEETGINAQSADFPSHNPIGEIPSVLTDAEGAQYAVFTPEKDGTFAGMDFEVTVAPGVVPSGEFVRCPNG